MTATPSSYEQFLRDFESTVRGASTRLRKLNPNSQGTSDKWGPHEILGHLIDSAANNHGRFVRAQATEDLLFPGYDQEHWVNAQHYRAEDWMSLVDLWTLYNLHVVHVVSQIPVDVLTRTRTKHTLDQIAWQTVPKNQSTTLEYLVRDYVGHLKHHLSQILGDQFDQDFSIS